jgi:hypothetical protein
LVNQPRTINPVSLAVVASLAIVTVILVIAGSIGGSYLLALHALHVQAAQAATLHTREAGTQVRTAIPTCKAFLGMAQASDTPPHLAHAIAEVVSKSKCGQLLRLVAQHVPFPEIARRLGGQ